MKSERVNTLFETEWYLDAAAPGWKVYTIDEDGQFKARLPYVERRQFGRVVIGTPPFMQSCGVWFRDTGGKLTSRLEFQKDLIDRIADMMPSSCDVDLYLNHKCEYALPWIWKGFKVSPAFTYRFENLTNLDAVWKGFRDKTKNEIRKAEKILTVRDDMSIEELIKIEDKTYARQHRRNRMDNEALRRVDEALLEHKARKLLCAVDENGNVHAAIYLAFDADCCHYMLGGGDPEYRNSQAASMLIWHGIQFAATVSKTFDFEGSVVPEIQHFFRSFGASPKPYWHVTRLHTLGKLKQAMKPIVKKILRYH